MKLRVMLVDASIERTAVLEQALKDADCEVVARVTTGEALFKRVERIQPDVIIIDQNSPDRDTLEQMRFISRDQPRPIVMFSESGDPETIQTAIKAGVSAYVVDGLSPGRVKPIVEVAIARFQAFQSLRLELEKTKESLAERKIIDRAKGILMQQRGIGEEQAYALLRKTAMENNLRIAAVAKSIIALAG